MVIINSSLWHLNPVLEVYEKCEHNLVEHELSLYLTFPNVAVDNFLILPHIVDHARQRVLTAEPVDSPLALRGVRAWSVFGGHDVIAIQIG